MQKRVVARNKKKGLLTPEQQDMANSAYFRNITLLPSGIIIDHTTGLIAVMVVNQVTHKITLVFGGTNSANGAGDLLDEKGQEIGKKPGRLRAQLKADWQNLTGKKIPDCLPSGSKTGRANQEYDPSKATLKPWGLMTLWQAVFKRALPGWQSGSIQRSEKQGTGSNIQSGSAGPQNNGGSDNRRKGAGQKWTD